ncbi:MAG TPA: mismatch repair protein [Terriglobia bacterium]|nr:mismatch repair protein [Terriglobia bacterium]
MEINASTPHQEYSQRLEASLKTVADKERLHIRAGNLKVFSILACLVVGWLSLARLLISPYWLALPATSFVILLIVHERILQAQSRAKRVASFYQRGLARIEDRWAGSGEAGERFRDGKSCYSEDLDLFGPGSLFQLISTARTRMGEDCLAKWLLSPSTIPAIVERQNLIEELRDKLDLRERLAAIGEDLRVILDPDALIRWAEGEAALQNRFLCWSSATLAVLALATLTLWGIAGISLPFFAVLLLEIIYMLLLQKRAKATLNGLDCDPHGLILFAQMLEIIEQEEFSASRLRQAVSKLKGADLTAGQSVRRLARVANWVEARDSTIVKILDLPILFTVQLGFAADAWRRRWGADVRAWIEAAGEVEALLSLASYAYEHPDDPFPSIAEDVNSQPLFEGENLGHPLIPSDRCVRNSVRLGAATRVLLVSGSNMSGKSTLLRSVGINTVLALAGAPVRAQCLRLTPLAVGSSIRASDSLRDGRSRFFTEILRIRQVYGLAEAGLPVLFLFDELLEGTNSEDRRVGAEGLIRAFMGHAAIGMVTTHDLALTEISESSNTLVRNVHFQESIEAGKMTFDYKLRDGVVKTSNALELMRLIGLKV